MATIGIDIRALLSPYRTGVGEYALQWVHALASSATEHRFVLFLNGSADFAPIIAQLPQSPRVRIEQFRMPNIFFNASGIVCARPRIDHLLKKRGIQIDLLFAPNINVINVSPQIPVVLTIHDLSFALFPRYFNVKERLWHRAVQPFRLMRDARMIVTPSGQTKRDVIGVAGMPPERVAVVAPGLSPQFLQRPDDADIERVRREHQLAKRYILHLGTMNARKNCHGLIEAFREMKRRSPWLSDLELVFAGADGQGSTLIRRAAAQDPSVVILGYVSSADKPALIAGSKLCMYPSLYEGFGFPIIEAMSMGVPVVTANRTSLPELGGQAAYYVNPHDVIDMAKGMQLVLTDQLLRDRMIRLGAEQAASFTWERATKQMFAVFDQCLLL